MNSAFPAAKPPNAEIARVLRRLVRFRDSVATWRKLGLPMPFRRRRKAALLNELHRLWAGGYAPSADGDMVFLPAPLDFQALRLLFDAGTVPRTLLAHVPEGGVAIDVGANLGEWTLPLARAAGAAGRVVAVEPNPAIARALERTIRINNMRQTVVKECGLSDMNGAANLLLNAHNTGMARLGEVASGIPAVTVPVTTLDVLAREQRLERLDLLKIDVEGHERQVLAGGRETLARFHPALVIETGHEGAADRAAIADLLASLEYEPIAVLLDHGGLPASFADYRAAQGACAGSEARNLLFLHNDVLNIS